MARRYTILMGSRQWRIKQLLRPRSPPPPQSTNPIPIPIPIPIHQISHPPQRQLKQKQKKKKIVLVLAFAVAIAAIAATALLLLTPIAAYLPYQGQGQGLQLEDASLIPPCTLLGCTGKHPRTQFLPISPFDDKTLLSDYNFLEETKRVAEAARRGIRGFRANYSGNLPPTLQMLRKAAFKRGTCLYFLPRGMQKRESNRSYFDRRKNCIYWTIERRFHSVHMTLTDHHVPENESLIEKHLSPTPWNDTLTSYCKVTLSNLRFFIQKRAKTSKSPFRELDIKSPISSQLRSVLILESPVIHVYLPTQTPDFDVEKCASHERTKVRDAGPSNQDSDSLAGVPDAKCSVYREEEIDEGEVEPETCIVDFSEHAAPKSKFGGVPSMSNFGTVASPKEGNQLHNIQEQMIKEEEGFDYDQEVKKAYNDLKDLNPDDFLCFDNDGFINNVHNYENNTIGLGGQEAVEEEISA